MFNLALVGSRDFHDYDRFVQGVEQSLEEWDLRIEDIKCIISGGAKGADTLAERFSKDRNIAIIVLSPDWNKLGKRAGLVRNSDIVEASTHMIAFPTKTSKGTYDSINKAKKKSIHLKIVNV
jgi:hypothetical protein